MGIISERIPPYTVYMFFDSDRNIPVYVGKSSSFLSRISGHFNQHTNFQIPYDEIKTVLFCGVESDKEMGRLEGRLINTFKPIFNLAYPSSPERIGQDEILSYQWHRFEVSEICDEFGDTHVPTVIYDVVKSKLAYVDSDLIKKTNMQIFAAEEISDDIERERRAAVLGAKELYAKADNLESQVRGLRMAADAIMQRYNRRIET